MTQETLAEIAERLYQTSEKAIILLEEYEQHLRETGQLEEDDGTESDFEFEFDPLEILDEMFDEMVSQCGTKDGFLEQDEEDE